jgi:Tfp pilus assembly protein PilF
MGLQDTKTVVDEVDPVQFDPMGSLVNGKKISTLDMPPGQYRLTATITDPETRERAAATVTFRVVTAQPTPESWDLIDPELDSDARDGTYELNRALCYLATGRGTEGMSALSAAFRRNPKNALVVGKLVDTFFSSGNFKEVTEIYTRTAITDKTDEKTILRMAESFDKVGQINSSTALLELAISLKPQSGPLYLALASYYQRTGNIKKADEMERKGRSFVSSSVQPGA